MHVCAYTYVYRKIQMASFITFYFTRLIQGLSLFIHWVSWLPSKPQQSILLSPSLYPSIGVKKAADLDFTWVLGTQTPVLMVLQHILLPTESSPQLLIKWFYTLQYFHSLWPHDNFLEQWDIMFPSLFRKSARSMFLPHLNVYLSLPEIFLSRR